METSDPRSRLGRVGCCVVATLLLCPSAASAVDRYAEPGGNGPDGAGGCLISDPCGLEDAVEGSVPADVNDGDRVLMLSGTHNAGAAEITITDAITVEPAPGAGRPVLSSTSPTRALFEFNSAGISTIRGFDIVHSNAAGRGLVLGSGDVAERMFVTGNGLSACSTSGSLLRDSVCVLAPSSVGSGALGTTVSGNTNLTTTLRNVTAISKAAGRPAIYLSAAGGADLIFSVHNVIADGNPDAFSETDGSASTSALIGFASSSFATATTAGTGASVTPPGGGSNNITAPAQFVNFASNDFHQAAGSPTIDKGSPDPLMGTLDFDGLARVQGPAPDIGAFEAPATPVTPVVIPTPPGAKPKKKCKSKKKRKKNAAAAKKKKKKKPCGKKKRRKKPKK